MTDAERLAAILAALPADDAAFLAAQMAPPYKRRAARMAERDGLVREALAAHAALPARPAAEALAAELRHMSATPRARGDRAELLHRILGLSGKGGLAWRRIMDIGAADFVQQKPQTLHNDPSMHSS